LNRIVGAFWESMRESHGTAMQTMTHWCGETLRKWVRPAERDQGFRPGPTSEERERIKALERENRELRQANEIMRKASAYFGGVDAPSRRDRDMPAW
jgi:transposase